jgi:hypothetical protein
LLPDNAVAPKNYQYEEKAAMHQLIKAGEKHWLVGNVIAYFDGAHYKNKQGPQNSEPVIF